MALRRIFVGSVSGSTATLSGSAAHHLSRVVRLRRGERVELSDHQNVYLAQVAGRTRDEVHFEVVERLDLAGVSAPVTLQLSIFKFARMEWVIEKATELGVDTIVPVAANRSDRSLVHAARKRRERWRRVAAEAAQQCRRVSPPAVGEPVRFADAVASGGGALRLFLDEDAPALRDELAANTASGSPLEAAVLIVGPEGGWIDSERRQAVEAGYHPVSLGNLILRTETAAIAAIAITTHWMADFTWASAARR